MKREISADGDGRTDSANGKKASLVLEFENSGAMAILHCEGHMAFGGEAQGFWTAVTDVLPSNHRLIVDLAGIDSIDVGGLGELVLTHMWAEASGYEMKFARARKPVRDLLEITNLVSVFDVYGSVPEAMAAIVDQEARTA